MLLRLKAEMVSVTGPNPKASHSVSRSEGQRGLRVRWVKRELVYIFQSAWDWLVRSIEARSE
jgi:hypothetical protein